MLVSRQSPLGEDGTVWDTGQTCGILDTKSSPQTNTNSFISNVSEPFKEPDSSRDSVPNSVSGVTDNGKSGDSVGSFSVSGIIRDSIKRNIGKRRKHQYYCNEEDKHADNNTGATLLNMHINNCSSIDRNINRNSEDNKRSESFAKYSKAEDSVSFRSDWSDSYIKNVEQGTIKSLPDIMTANETLNANMTVRNSVKRNRHFNDQFGCESINQFTRQDSRISNYKDEDSESRVTDAESDKGKANIPDESYDNVSVNVVEDRFYKCDNVADLPSCESDLIIEAADDKSNCKHPDHMLDKCMGQCSIQAGYLNCDVDSVVLDNVDSLRLSKDNILRKEDSRVVHNIDNVNDNDLSKTLSFYDNDSAIVANSCHGNAQSTLQNINNGNTLNRSTTENTSSDTQTIHQSLCADDAYKNTNLCNNLSSSSVKNKDNSEFEEPKTNCYVQNSCISQNINVNDDSGDNPSNLSIDDNLHLSNNDNLNLSNNDVPLRTLQSSNANQTIDDAIQLILKGNYSEYEV